MKINIKHFAAFPAVVLLACWFPSETSRAQQRTLETDRPTLQADESMVTLYVAIKTTDLDHLQAEWEAGNTAFEDQTKSPVDEKFPPLTEECGRSIQGCIKAWTQRAVAEFLAVNPSQAMKADKDAAETNRDNYLKKAEEATR